MVNKNPDRIFIFYLIVGSALFLGSFNLNFDGRIFTLDALVNNYFLLTVGLIFLIISFMKYVEYKFLKRLSSKNF